MTAVTQIIGWVNEASQPAWLKASLRLLLKKDKLEENDLNFLFRIARVESGFKDDINLEDHNALVSGDGYFIEEHPVVLKKIGPVNNIGLISDGAFIDLPEDGLTVIYGNNGAGKSSYARILKNICLTRGDKPIVRSNVFREEQAIPLSQIEYRVGNTDPVVISWSPNNSDFPDLKAIRIFDSKSASHYVEKEDKLGYRPAGLHLLDHLGSAFTFIRENAQQSKNNISNPHALPKLSTDTAAGKFITKISKNTTKAQLEEHLITENELIELEKLPTEIAALITNTADKIRKDYSQKISRYVALSKDMIDPLCGVAEISANEIEYLRSNLIIKQNALDIARNAAFSEMPIEGVGSTTWKTLWDAAKLYSEVAYPGQDFPVLENAMCPLCIQEIGDEASVRLNRFKEFVMSTVQAEKDAAGNLFNKARKTLLSINYDLVNAMPVINEISEELNNFDKSIEALFLTLSERRNFLAANIEDKREGMLFPEIDTSHLERLSEYILKLSNDLASIQDDDGLNQLISKKNNILKELKGKKELTENRSTIEKEISRQKAVDAYTQIGKQANTLHLTRLSTQINNLYVTSALEQNFQEELKFFGLKYFPVGTKTRGEAGNNKFSLEIENANRASLGEIASEGEAKCFALSGALAELRTDNRLSGIVFDDPVNSLDHKWTVKVASRLVKESLIRQVIIFTHDIVFLKLLCESSESTEGHSLVIKSLDRSKTTAGIVRSNPPWDALTTSKRITYLNVLHRELKKIDQDGTEEEYNEKASRFYGLLREAWERLVEEKLLNKVVERFSRGIPTQRLSKVVDIEQSDIDRVNLAMAKCSALLDGHDTAPGLYEPMPRPDEIKTDIDVIKNYEQELSNLRKRS